MEKGAVLPLFYLPNVEFFKNLYQYKDLGLFIEKQEHYPKQTFRNRTSIAGPNGQLDLTVPVQKGSNARTAFKDVRISNEDKWQRIHWLSLETSYRSSAYFEFYEDAFAPFYHKKYDFLFDYNLELLQVILKLLKTPVAFELTKTYEKEYENLTDLRSAITPNKGSDYQNKKYFQVFEDRNGYINNISIVDLLFNQGPQAVRFF
jgi:WbqC-like protein family